MTNDYKRDKPPIMDALLPFYPALRALAACMDDMQHKHKLAGAADPFNEWRNLPRAKQRLANAGLGHILQGPWKVNTEDGTHLHMTHALFGVLASLTVHIEDNTLTCCGAADAVITGDGTGTALPPIHGPAGADWREGRPLTLVEKITHQPGNPGLLSFPRCQWKRGSAGPQCTLPNAHTGQHQYGEDL